MGYPRIKRNLLLRWEEEQKAQHQKQPLQPQHQNQPHNQETQGLTPRSHESRPSPEQSAEPELSFDEWLKSQKPSDGLIESSSSMASGQANSPHIGASAKVISQGVEIEYDGGNANEKQENPQNSSFLEDQGLIPRRERTPRGRDRGSTNQDAKGRGRGNTNEGGKGRGRGNTKQDGKGGARSEGNATKVQAGEGVTARSKESTRSRLLVKKQGRDTEPNESDADEEHGNRQTSSSLDCAGLIPKQQRTQKGRGRGNTNQDGKGRGRGNANEDGKGGARNERNTIKVQAGEGVTPLSKESSHPLSLVKRQGRDTEPIGSDANEEEGNSHMPSLLDYPGKIPNWLRTEKGRDRDNANLDGKGRGRGRAKTMGNAIKNVGRITQGCKGKSSRKQREDSDSESDDPSFTVMRKSRLAKPRSFVGMD